MGYINTLVIGPIVGGFVAENPHLGWHFNFWLIFIFSAITLVIGYFVAPETVRIISIASIPTSLNYLCSMHPFCCVAVHKNFLRLQTAQSVMFRHMMGIVISHDHFLQSCASISADLSVRPKHFPSVQPSHRSTNRFVQCLLSPSPSCFSWQSTSLSCMGRSTPSSPRSQSSFSNIVALPLGNLVSRSLVSALESSSGFGLNHIRTSSIGE